MPQRGGRTAKRAVEDIFKQSIIKRPSGGATTGDQFCKGTCGAFCEKREIILRELVKASPDFTNIREDYVDFRTISDILDGGQCTCDCPVYNLGR